MKGKIAGITCVLVLIGAWAYAQTRPTPTSTVSLPAGAAGRYQLAEADVDIPGTSSNLKYKSAMRIDTQTGQTWTLGRVVNRETGIVTVLWTKVDEETNGR